MGKGESAKILAVIWVIDMRRWKIAVFILALAPAAPACDLKYDAVSAPRYYREEGWKLPGIHEFKPHQPGEYNEYPMMGVVPGAQASVLAHEYPYIVSLPVQEFVLNGARQRMRAMQVKATIIRWMMDDHVVAYSYGLIPVNAHKKKGKWVIKSEAGCIFTVTFVDDRGDGVFRLLVPNAFTHDLVPLWVKPKHI